METQSKYNFSVDDFRSEDARVEALVWRIYDIIYNKNKGNMTSVSRCRKTSSQEVNRSVHSPDQIEDLFDMLHLEA